LKSFSKDLATVPNMMSLFRIIAAPTLAFFWFALDMHVTALVIGTVAGVTDLFDGIVARKLNQITKLGSLIDQLGDLVFESCALLIAVMIGEFWMGWLIIYLFREFTVTVIRSYVHSQGGKMPSSNLGRAKSSLLQYAFFLMFLGAILVMPGVLPESWTLYGISPGRVLIWVSRASMITGITISLIAAWLYLKAFAKFYSEQLQGKA
jgi:cardiolipin synthase